MLCFCHTGAHIRGLRVGARALVSLGSTEGEGESRGGCVVAALGIVGMKAGAASFFGGHGPAREQTLRNLLAWVTSPARSPCGSRQRETVLIS